MIKIIESLNKESLTILTPWKMVATYENHPEEIEFYGSSEEDCMNKIADAQSKYGECTWYSGCNDEYYVDGEYVESINESYESDDQFNYKDKIIKLISFLTKASIILEDDDLQNYINDATDNYWDTLRDINDYIEALRTLIG